VLYPISISLSEKISGRILTSDGRCARAALTIRGGRIESVGEPDGEGREYGDALLLPGAVDVHVHTRSYVEEGIERCTRAAAAGGVTTIVDMPYDASGPIDSLAAFEAKVTDVEREAVIDVALWATVPPRGPIGDVSALVAAGAAAFKLSTFETHPQRFPRIPDGQLLAAFTEIARAGGLAGVHAENDEIVRAGIAAEQAAGHGGDPLAHARSRPPVAEHEAIARVLELARATGVRLHVCHVSTTRGVQLVAQARREGVDVSAETCPHYLLLDESALAARGGEAKINPPLRVARLSPDGLDLISSDHVGWPIERKHGPDIFALASGAPGVELIVPLVHDELGAAELARLVAELPAKRFGLWPRKGSLRPGSDADVMVLDPDREWQIDPATLVTAAGWSPYAGRRVRGRVVATFSRGVQVWDGERVLAEPGHGRFVPANTRSVGGSTAAGRFPPGKSPQGKSPERFAPSSPPERFARCHGWRQETILRLLENNLAIAEDPEHLVVYAAHAKAARDHPSLDAIVSALQSLEDGHTLVIQSGKPIAVLPTGPRAPAVLLANGNLVGRWATPDVFYDLERRNLIAWGGLTAGCWQYIGSQGVLQGTYETFAQVGREHFGGTLRGRLVVSAGLGGMGAAQPMAVTRMLGATTLIAEADGDKARRRQAEGVVDVVSADIDEVLDSALRARGSGSPLAIAFAGNAAELLEGLLARDVVPDVVTDLTAAHDLRSGYLPVGIGVDEAADLRRGDPGKLEAMALATMVRHVRAMLALRERGAVVFDYGNNIRPHAAAGGVPEALGIDIFTARYLRPLFCRGIGPFRWICVSGDDGDLALIDELCEELFADVPRITDWIGLARAHVKHQGLPARIAWLGHGERTRLGVAVNQAVADGRLRGPVAFTRDHMDSGAMTHPNIITEGMADGSDPISDWPLLNALLNTASGADLVALHAGGGGYAGFSQSSGLTVVATGDDDAAARLAAALNVDTAIGVLRHADAGYPQAIESAREHGLGLGVPV
jgi:urocanate hydratase